MEVSGVVTRRVSGFFHGESDALSGVSNGSKTRNWNSTQLRVLNSGFCDDGHLKYYVGNEKSMKKEDVKRELKFLKGLSADNYASSHMGFDGFVQGNLVSVKERTETLVRQLQQLKAEEKELKRKKKQEKAKLKAARKRTGLDSSSSSESSESERDVISTSYHRMEVHSQAVVDRWKTNTFQESTMTFPSPLTEQCCLAEQNSNLLLDLQNRAQNGSVVHYESSSAAASGKRVEVCMGNKCKKAGAAMLMEEFERVLGTDGAVCGCKCMGECRDGPNVRVMNSLDKETSTLTNPLYIGVGMEDVDRIAANFIGRKDSSLVPAT